MTIAATWLLMALSGSTVDGVETCSAKYYRDVLLGPARGITFVAAHRGYHAVAPENSLSAIDAAIAAGIEIVEIDIRKTADGVYVLMHDETLDRTTNGKGPIVEQSYAAVRRLRLRDADGKLTDERVPSLKEALKLNAGRTLLMLDSKVDRPEDVQSIATLVKEHDKSDEVILYDFHPEIAMALRQAVPGALTMLRIKERKLIPWYLASYRFELLIVEPGFVVTRAGPSGELTELDLFVNLLGSQDTKLLNGDVGMIDSLLAADVRVIQTDHPLLLRSVIAERAEAGARSSATRLWRGCEVPR